MLNSTYAHQPLTRNEPERADLGRDATREPSFDALSEAIGCYFRLEG
jgi:hypothetical protein